MAALTGKTSQDDSKTRKLLNCSYSADSSCSVSWREDCDLLRYHQGQKTPSLQDPHMSWTSLENQEREGRSPLQLPNRRGVCYKLSAPSTARPIYHKGSLHWETCFYNPTKPFSTKERKWKPICSHFYSPSSPALLHLLAQMMLHFPPPKNEWTF